MTIDRKEAKREARKKQLIEQQRLRLEDVSEESALDNAELMVDGNKYESAKPAGLDVEDSGSDEDGGVFVNPLLKANTADKSDPQESEEWSDDDESDGKGKKDKKKKDKSMLGKRKRKDEGDGFKDFFGNEVIEEVPADDPGTLKMKGYESMDSDDIAETRILARKMLRKKARTEIMDSTYNKYATHEDPDTLPSWFVEDEARHRFCERWQPTKEEMAAEKEAIKEYNTRPSKKVEQAKARKRKRLDKAMQKIKKRATIIADQDMTESLKMKQIQKMYRKEKEKHKEEKTYVVNKSFNTAQGKKAGRGMKMVDKRLRKDQRNDKFKAKRGKRGKPSPKAPKINKGGRGKSTGKKKK